MKKNERKFVPDNYTEYLAGETWREFACRASDADELVSWQNAFRPRLAEALGIPHIRERGACELDPLREEAVELDECVRELWTIQSEPGFRIPFLKASGTLLRSSGQYTI